MIGIYLMGFVILVGGVGVLGMAIAYAIRPTEQKLMLMRPLSLAAIFAAICSSSVGVATALKHASDAKEVSPEALSMMLGGLSESLVPPFVAFAFLAVAWLLVAAGMRRSS
ncbi:MAG: hypothetical protein NTY02_02045 [Acidobacteria bacterium]|nr:hypothetical protein [Acidobacteriota bacterium]